MSIDRMEKSIEVDVVDRIADELVERYAKILAPEIVRETVSAAYEEISRTARVRTFLPTLAGRYADDQIKAKAIANGLMESDEPRVVFVCPSNTGRSQIAAALLARKSGGKITVRSGAGVRPGGHLHHLAVEALQEQGIDLSDLFPKKFTSDAHQAAEYIVTMDCSDEIDHLADKNYISWDIPTLANKPMKEVREIIALIEQKTDDLLNRLSVDTA